MFFLVGIDNDEVGHFAMCVGGTSQCAAVKCCTNTFNLWPTCQLLVVLELACQPSWQATDCMTLITAAERASNPRIHSLPRGDIRQIFQQCVRAGFDVQLGDGKHHFQRAAEM